jgi:uncharacterized protein (DUF427 family)
MATTTPRHEETSGRELPLPPTEHIHVEVSPRRVRVRFGSEFVADSRHALLLLEEGLLPVYYFPPEDVRTDLMTPTERHTTCQYKGNASYWTVRVGDRVAEDAVWAYPDPLPERADIAGYMAFYWDKMDAWFEEDDEVFVHPRSPYHRVDVLNSSRHVQVIVGGEVVADSHRPRLLFETGLPTRYYLPKIDVRMDLLEPTDTVTRCPHKGKAQYWSVRVGDKVFRDMVWSYSPSMPECPRIDDLVCFFNERVEAIVVDGERQPVPRTRWSRTDS